MISLLLVGRTGTGKSCTGNNIIGRNKFRSSSGTTSVTKKCEVQYSRTLNHNVRVIDCPGLADTDLEDHESLQKFCSEIEEVLRNHPDGFDAILIVTEMGRQTEQDERVIQQLNAVFGRNFTRKYAILVVTHADNFDPDENPGQSVEQWCQAQTGFFQTLKDKCDNRVVLFDNKSRDAFVHRKQLESLFTLVSLMRTRSRSRRYVLDIYLQAQATRDRALLEAELPIIQQKINKYISQITHILNNLDNVDVQSLPTLEVLRRRSEQYLTDIQLKDKGTGILDGIVDRVQNVIADIEIIIAEARQAQMLQRRRQKLAERQRLLTYLQEDLDRQRRERQLRRAETIWLTVGGIAVFVSTLILRFL